MVNAGREAGKSMIPMGNFYMRNGGEGELGSFNTQNEHLGLSQGVYEVIRGGAILLELSQSCKLYLLHAWNKEWTPWPA